MSKEKRIFEDFAEEILEEFARFYSQVDKERLARMIYKKTYRTAKSEIAREIFEEIERSTINSNFEFMFVSKKYFAELKKKYTEGDKENEI